MQYACGMSRETAHLTRAAAMVVFLLLLANPVAAQTPTPTPAPIPQPIAPLKVAPIPRFVVDFRSGFASLGSDTITASSLGVIASDMPGKALTAVVGAHVYLFREGRLKLGVGAEAVRGSGSNQRVDAAGKASGPVIRRRLEGVSGQISLNFGRGRGWSYITVGGGPTKFESYLDDAKPTRAGDTTLNYGGGARWFIKTHLAFTVDLRFYVTRPATASLDGVARGRRRVTLLSAGISLK